MNIILKTQYITSIGLFYKNMGFYLEGVWLWRISGGLLTGDDGVGLGESNIYHQFGGFFNNGGFESESSN